MIEEPYYFFEGNTYTGTAPAFYDKAGFEWIPFLESNWHVIRDEMLAGLEAEDIPVPNHNPNLVTDARIWRNICFVNYLWQKKKVCRRYPKTWALLKQIPYLSYASLNLLEPHSEIKAHQGDTNITARCHLGLVIPAGLPACGLEVDGKQTAWQEGKVFAFSDAHWHRAWNETDKKRFVFVIDVVLPPYAKKRELYCSIILAVLSLKAVTYKLKLKISSPPPGAKLLLLLTAGLWWTYLQIQKIISFV